MTFVLEKELQHFESIKDELLKHYEGKAVVIHGGRVMGVWDTEESAYIKGVELLGTKPFLLKRVLAEDPVVDVPLLFIGDS